MGVIDLGALEAFGLVAGVASIVGVVLAVRYARQAAQKTKHLCFNRTASDFPVVSAKALRDYNISVIYTPTSGTEERVDSVFVYYLVFANLGKEPIRRDDIAPGNPLRIEVAGTRVLDISVEAVTRDVINIDVGVLSSSAGVSTAPVTFDFLDFEDGGLLRILSTSRPSRLELLGDIVGMPQGVTSEKPIRDNAILRRIGAAAITLLFVGAATSAAFAYRWVTGSWKYVWVLLLPLLALVLPLMIIVAVSETLWPKPRFRFPKSITPTRPRFLPWMFDGSSEVHLLMGREGEILSVHPSQASDRKPQSGAGNMEASERPTDEGQQGGSTGSDYDATSRRS